MAGSWCGFSFNPKLSPGGTCPDGSTSTAQPPLVASPAKETTVTGDKQATPPSTVVGPQNSQGDTNQVTVGGKQYTVETLSTDWLNSRTPQELAALKKQLRAGGNPFLGPKSNKFSDVRDALIDAAHYASAQGANGGSTDLYTFLNVNSKVPGGSSTGRYTGPTQQSTTNISTKENARTDLDAAAVPAIGRRLTDKEMAIATTEYQQMQAKNPTVSLTVPNGHNSSTTTSQPIDKAEMLRQILAKNPDFAENQIDTSVLQWFMDDIAAEKKVAYG